MLEEQNRKFEEALKKDREKQERERLEREKREKEEEMRRKKEEEMKKLEEIKRQEREKKRQTLPSEPDINEKDVSRILIRLASGDRIERRFRITETIGTIFDFLCVEKMLDVEKFDLVSNFPTKIYTFNESNKISLKDAKLYPHASLFVREKD